MRIVWVDVESPVLGVYEESLVTKVPDVGATFDFGVLSMPGAWRVLSVERPWIDGVPDPTRVRVNVIRYTPRSECGPWRICDRHGFSSPLAVLDACPDCHLDTDIRARLQELEAR
jgi:hypothetical protein